MNATHGCSEAKTVTPQWNRRLRSASVRLSDSESCHLRPTKLGSVTVGESLSSAGFARSEMKTLVLVFAIVMCFPISGGEPEGGMLHTYLLREPHPLDLQKMVRCAAVSSATLREGEFIEDLGKGTLLAQVKPATDTLELTLSKDRLRVRSGGKTPEGYKITSDGESFLGAASIGRSVPVVSSILIDKIKGYASWTTNDRTSSELVFFVCE